MALLLGWGFYAPVAMAQDLPEGCFSSPTPGNPNRVLCAPVFEDNSISFNRPQAYSDTLKVSGNYLDDSESIDDNLLIRWGIVGQDTITNVLNPRVREPVPDSQDGRRKWRFEFEAEFPVAEAGDVIGDTLFLQLELQEKSKNFQDVFVLDGFRVFPSPPDSVSTTPADRRVTVNWTASLGGVDGYHLYRSTEAGFEISETTLIASDLTDTTYLDLNVDNATTYFYRVVATAKGFDSEPSVQTEATPFPIPPVPTISSVDPPAPDPGQAATISATITDADANLVPSLVNLIWRVTGSPDSTIVAMSGTDSLFTAEIPGQPGGTQVQFYVQAQDLLANLATTTTDVINWGDVQLPPVIESLTLSPNPPDSTQEVTVRARVTDANEDIAEVNLRWRINNDTTTVPMVPSATADEYEAVIPAQGAGATVNLQVEAVDAQNLSTTADSSYTVIDPSAPRITAIELTPNPPDSTQEVTVRATVTDEDGDLNTVSLTWTAGENSTTEVMSSDPGTDLFASTLPPLPQGTRVDILIEAADLAGNTVVRDTFYTVKSDSNRAPILIAEQPDAFLILDCLDEFQIAISTLFEDPDGDPLTYTYAILDTAIVQAAIIPGNMLLVEARGIGTTEIRLVATDPFGASVQDTVLVTVDGFITTQIVPTNDIATEDEAFAFEVDIFISQEAGGRVFPLGTPTLFYRRAGDVTFQAGSFSTPGTTTYQFDIPAASVTERGIEYYIEAENQVCGSSRFPAQGVNSIRVRVENLVYEHPRLHPEAEYRIVSVPLELDAETPFEMLNEDLGAYDDQEWRFFSAFKPLNQSEYTLTEYDDIDALESGKGYWLITRDEAPAFGTGGGLTHITSTPFLVPLEAGWSLIGNPFAFPIPIQNVSLTSGDPLDILAYDAGNQLLDIPTLEVFEGYAIHVFSPDTLIIDPSRRSPSSRQEASEQALPAWGIEIIASNGQAVDRGNRAQVHEQAETQWDALDHVNPALLDQKLDVYFANKHWKERKGLYRVDTRPLTKSNLSWDFEVTSSNGDAVTLTFEGLEEVPADHAIRLYDVVLDEVIDLRETPHYNLSASRTPRPFELHIGADASTMPAHENAALPESISLQQNFPNPFNPSTTIPFSLPADMPVQLDVYDALGQRVATLLQNEMKAAGRHTVIWEARNDAGHMVSSGLYFIRLEAGGSVQVKQTVLLK